MLVATGAMVSVWKHIQVRVYTGFSPGGGERDRQGGEAGGGLGDFLS